MRIILDTDYEQNFVDLWNPEKNYWERYIQCEKKETKPLNEEDKKIPEKSILNVDSDANGSYDTVIINGAEYQISRVERYMLGKINEIIDYINGGTNGE